MRLSAPLKRGRTRRLTFALVLLAALAVGLLALPASAAATGVRYGYVWEWGQTGILPGQFADNAQSPWGIALDAQGNVFVADAYNYRIQKFSPNGTFICQFGSFGSGAQQLNNPYDVAVGSDGAVYVLDSANDRVQVFTSSDGHTYTSVARWAIPAPNTDHRCWGIACDAGGNVWVTKNLDNCLVKFDSSGTVVTTLYGTPAFDQPDSVAVGADGKLYISDWNNLQVRVFSLQDGVY